MGAFDGRNALQHVADAALLLAEELQQEVDDRQQRLADHDHADCLARMQMAVSHATACTREGIIEPTVEAFAQDILQQMSVVHGYVLIKAEHV